MTENERMDVELGEERAISRREPQAPEQKDNFVRNTLVVGLVALVLLLVIWGMIQTRPVAPIATASENQKVVVVQETASEECATTTGSQLQEAIAVVEFAPGWDSNGRFIAKGSVINGPAIIKPNPNTAEFIAIYPGKSFTLDNDCVAILRE